MASLGVSGEMATAARMPVDLMSSTSSRAFAVSRARDQTGAGQARAAREQGRTAVGEGLNVEGEALSACICYVLDPLEDVG